MFCRRSQKYEDLFRCSQDAIGSSQMGRSVGVLIYSHDSPCPICVRGGAELPTIAQNLKSICFQAFLGVFLPHVQGVHVNPHVKTVAFSFRFRYSEVQSQIHRDYRVSDDHRCSQTFSGFLMIL